MTRGRKPRAISVNEENGSYKNNPARRPNNIIKADERAPEPPSIIAKDKTSLRIWEETCEVLADAKILSKTDTHLLTRYVLTYTEWLKVGAYIQKHGHSDENGKTSPQSVAFFKLSTEHSKLIGELGLTPSSRARLSVATSDPADAKKESDLATYIKAIKSAG